jgi:hypothetical protein
VGVLISLLSDEDAQGKVLHDFGQGGRTIMGQKRGADDVVYHVWRQRLHLDEVFADFRRFHDQKGEGGCLRILL